LLDKYRVQGHYLINACFWGDKSLLERAQTLADLPTAMIHGQLDWICTPEAAWTLHRHLPGSRLQWLDSSGHSPFEPAMAQALGQAMAHFATHRQFDTWGQDLRTVGQA
jgi:proline iminopeptidase